MNTSKMVSIKKILLFVSLVFVGCFAISQQTKPDQYRAVQWTMADGLSKDEMNTIIKDSKGFMWVGSANGGFCRFDGATFKKYPPEENNRNTINSDKIFSFTEDSLNNIWIRTDKGLSRYDIKADTFTNSLIDSTSSSVLLGAFCATKEEVFCVERGGFISAFNIHTLKKRKLIQLPIEDDPGMNWSTSRSFFDATSNSLWVLPETKQNSVLQQIFLNGSSKTKYYPWPCFRNNVQHRHSAEDIKYDSKRNSIWVNSGDGLLEFSLNDQQFRMPEAMDDYIKSKEYDRDVGIDIDINGRVWFATKSNGILIYDPKTGTVQPLFSHQDPQKKAGEANLHIYCDRDGIVWTANYESFGIYELLPFNSSVKRYAAKPQIPDSLSDGFVITIIPAAQGKMWIGTSEGINIFDPISEKFEVLREKDLPGITGKVIAPVYIDTVRQMALLYAAPAGRGFYDRGRMYEMDINTRKCRQITFRDHARQFDTLTIDPNQVRPYKNGVLVSTDHYGLFEIKEGSLFADLVVPLYTKAATKWVTLADERRVYIKLYQTLPNFAFENKNGQWEKIPHPLDSVDWFSMIYNKNDQTYWASFFFKLIHYDKGFGEIKTYTDKDGYTGLAYNMVLDNAGNLWFVNIINQVGRLNTSTGIITMLSEIDGYHKKNFDWATPMAKDIQGNLYFGTGLSKGGEGLDRVYPQKYSSATTSSVYLQSLTINQKPFPFSVGVNNLEKLSLRYNQNTINIETGIIDFYANGKGHMRYKLEKNNEQANWQYGPAYYTLRYEGLPAGSYRLIMQASNAGNEFNGPEKVLVITIKPPFWETWWFRITAVICTAALFYGVITWRLQQKFRLQLERSEKERQVAELQQQKTEVEMQALRAQMNPHFIFNSLNSINRFILKKQGSEASEYLTKFSKLIRMILNSSANEAVSLAEDLEALKLYLELESLRFENRFNYKVDCHPDVDPEFIQVPPMLLQPFVENAIWHGLMNKESVGHLWINIDQHDSTIICTITDDGIGRKKAAEFKQASAKHKSMGMKITESRIAIMQKGNADGKSIEITDLVDADGNAAGTEVIIKMPVIFE